MAETRRIAATDVVVLVPGFLGFARFGGFYYFADRVVAVLRGLLEEHAGSAVPVVPCATLPTHGLADRQRYLLNYLRRLCTETLSDVERIHLIGHSTGGVDAQLLACTTGIEGRTWRREDDHTRAKIASVVTIASPHHGTGLAESRLARLGENPLAHPTAILPLASTLFNLLLLMPRSAAATAGFRVVSPNDVLKFVWQIRQSRELIADLRPAAMEKLRTKLRPDPRIPLTCFVTGTSPREDAERPSDPFFRDLYELTVSGWETPSAPVGRCARFLAGVVRNQPELVIRSARSLLPNTVDAAVNDGVVNTARQLVDCEQPGQLAGVVIADHADVLGHYDRRDALIEGQPLNAGLLHSGAGFGDDQFFELYRRAAAAIMQTIPRNVERVTGGRARLVEEPLPPPPPPAPAG